MNSGALGETQRRVLQDVMVLKDKISEVENELLEASEEMRKEVGSGRAEGFGHCPKHFRWKGGV